MKRVAVICGEELHDVDIDENTTTKRLLEKLHLPLSYFLSGRDAQRFGENEKLWHQVGDGEKLYASAPVTEG